MTDFWGGLTAWVNGWKFIMQNRRLFLVALTPFLISFAAAGFSIWLLWIYYPLLMNSVVLTWIGSIEGTWMSVLIQPLIWIGGILVTLIVLYVVYALHAVVAQPFYALLAERTLKLKGRTASSDLSFWSLLKVSVIKALVFLAIGIVLLLVSFIPVVNMIAFGGTLLLLAFDCFDYALEAQRLGFRARIRYVLKNKSQWVGMGFGLALTLLLPGLTLLVIPGAVVGAALILKEENESRIIAS